MFIFQLEIEYCRSTFEFKVIRVLFKQTYFRSKHTFVTKKQTYHKQVEVTVVVGKESHDICP